MPAPPWGVSVERGSVCDSWDTHRTKSLKQVVYILLAASADTPRHKEQGNVIFV